MTSGLSSGGPAPLPLGPQAWEGAHRLVGVQGLRRKSSGLEGREAEADPCSGAAVEGLLLKLLRGREEEGGGGEEERGWEESPGSSSGV